MWNKPPGTNPCPCRGGLMTGSWSPQASPPGRCLLSPVSATLRPEIRTAPLTSPPSASDPACAVRRLPKASRRLETCATTTGALGRSPSGRALGRETAHFVAPPPLTAAGRSGIVRLGCEDLTGRHGVYSGLCLGVGRRRDRQSGRSHQGGGRYIAEAGTFCAGHSASSHHCYHAGIAARSQSP